MKWELVLWVWQQEDWHHWLSVTCFCVAMETTLLLHSGANSVEKNKLVESNGKRKKKKKKHGCMHESSANTYTQSSPVLSLRAACQRLPARLVAKHSRRRDHTREQKQHQTVVKTTGEGSNHLWLKHAAIFNSKCYHGRSQGIFKLGGCGGLCEN